MVCQASAGALGLALGGEHRDVVGDLGGEQPAVLIAAVVGIALDVEHDPAGLRVAIGRAVSLDGRRGDRLVRG